MVMTSLTNSALFNNIGAGIQNARNPQGALAALGTNLGSSFGGTGNPAMGAIGGALSGFASGGPMGAISGALAGTGNPAMGAIGSVLSGLSSGNPLGAASGLLGSLGAMGPAGAAVSQLARTALGALGGQSAAGLAGAAAGSATGAAAAGSGVNCSPPASSGGQQSQQGSQTGNGQGENNVSPSQNTQGTDNGTIDRSQSQAINDLNSNPELRSRLYAFTEAEVGSQGSAAQQAFMESVINRADARGQSIDSVLSNNGYWPSSTLNRVNAGYNPGAMNTKYSGIFGSVAGGSNVCNFCTGNASGSVGFGGGPQTSSYGGEKFGIENNSKDRNWASGRGFKK